MNEIPTEVDIKEIEKEKAKLKAFITPETKVAGLSLRPLTAGSLIVLKMVDNPIVGENPETATNMEFHIAGFIYCHSAPVTEVRQASQDKAVWADKVLEFMEKLSISDFIQAADQIKVIVEASGVGADYGVKDDEKKMGKPHVG